MKCTMISTALCLLVLLATGPAFGLGTSGGHDLDALWQRAQQTYDLDEQDAVVLLESLDVTVDKDGTVATRVHRVVWIGGSPGIHSYADLRVPWHSGTSSLKVEKLRTWRDGRWWPDPEQISDTAVVETLPQALRTAADYTDVRETMLLHDGVELPCIMETMYTITETGQPGADGIFVFPQRDPALRVQLRLTTPAGSTAQDASLSGAPEPVRTTENGKDIATWRMDSAGQRKLPLTGQPEAFEPAVIWSTWADWSELATTWLTAFTTLPGLPDAAVDSLHNALRATHTEWRRARAVANYVDETVRPVHYDATFWRNAPRPAARTWSTAYGHDLDRAVLILALLKEAGLTAEPILLVHGTQKVVPELPRLADLSTLLIEIQGRQEPILIDPHDASVSSFAGRFGRPVWRPAAKAEGLAGSDSPGDSQLLIDLTLTRAEDGWQTGGHVTTTGEFCLHGRTVGALDAFRSAVEHTIGDVLPGTSLDFADPEVFNQAEVTADVGLTVAALEKDDRDELRLVMGDPGDGVLSRLPGVQRFQADRTSPVAAGSILGQKIVLRIPTDGLEVVHLPQAYSVANEAGRFDLQVDRKGGWLTISRKLQLKSAWFSGDLWPQLRTLLNEENDPTHRTLIFKAFD